MSARDNLRVLCVSRGYGTNAGGMERLSYEFIDALSRQENIQVTKLVLPFNAGASLRRRHIRALIFALAVIPAALSAARSADVIHLGDPLLSLAGWLIKNIRHKKIVVSVHGLDVSFPNAFYQWYLQVFFTNFDTYVPISQAAAAALARLNVRGRVAIIHPGIQDRLFNPSLSRARLEKLLGFNTADKIILVTHGRLVKRKGQAWFIAQVLPSLAPSVHYVISGDGPERNNIEELTAKLNLAGRVHFLGQVSDQDAAVLCNTADIYIQPNIAVEGDREGFGLVVVEAALCQRVVLAARLEGLQEAITDTKNGRLIPSADARAWQTEIEKIMALSQEERQTLGRQAREYSLAAFAWPRVIQRHVAALRS